VCEVGGASVCAQCALLAAAISLCSADSVQSIQYTVVRFIGDMMINSTSLVLSTQEAFLPMSDGIEYG